MRPFQAVRRSWREDRRYLGMILLLLVFIFGFVTKPLHNSVPTLQHTQTVACKSPSVQDVARPPDEYILGTSWRHDFQLDKLLNRLNILIEAIPEWNSRNNHLHFFGVSKLTISVSPAITMMPR